MLYLQKHDTEMFKIFAGSLNIHLNENNSVLEIEILVRDKLFDFDDIILLKSRWIAFAHHHYPEMDYDYLMINGQLGTEVSTDF
jgi:hypothetical protein